jgi:hypothetical protein
MKSFRELQTEATKQTKKGVIAKAARKGTPPYTVVVLDRLNKVVKQETTQVADAVPAFVHELQKRYPKGDYKISVEDKGGSRVYSEEVEMEEGTSASEKGSSSFQPTGHGNQSKTQSRRTRSFERLA